MALRRNFILSAFVASMVIASCNNNNPLAQPEVNASRPSDPDNKPESFPLALDESKWAQSKYCGDVRPELPADPTPAYTFENELINSKLGSEEGLKGWVHGAVPRYRQFLFTYRKEDASDPMAFFKSQQFSLIPANEAVAAKFQELKRHDQLVLKGRILQNGSPLVHIKVTDLQIVKKYEHSTTNEYTFDERLLNNATEVDVFGMVHATAHSAELGWAIIVERDSFIVPIAVDASHAEAASKLFRGDIVNVSLSVIRRGNGPVHFATNSARPNAIQVVDSILNCHGAQREVEGTLAKFHQSPAISLDVYAVRFVDANGLGRNMTFFPADGVSEAEFMEIFTAISAKAKAAWDQSQTEPVVVRNFYEKSSIKVKAKGILNVVSTEQANAQVYIRSADDVSFEVLR